MFWLERWFSAYKVPVMRFDWQQYAAEEELSSTHRTCCAAVSPRGNVFAALGAIQEHSNPCGDPKCTRNGKRHSTRVLKSRGAQQDLNRGFF